MKTDNLKRTKTQDQNERLENVARQAFIKSYGKIGEHLDEDIWMSWYGIWWSAWQEATEHEATEWLTTNKDSKPEPAS